MISLIKGLWQRYFDPPIYRILIIGLDGAGKTSLLNRLKQLAKLQYLQFEKIPKTMGLNMQEIDYFAKKNYFVQKYKVLYWDLGGSSTQRNIWKKYYPECHGIIFVIDGDRSDKWNEVQDCFKYKLNNILFIKDPSHDQVPILILVNNKKGGSLNMSKIQSLTENINKRIIKIQIVDIVQNINVIESVKLLHDEIGQLFQMYN